MITSFTWDNGTEAAPIQLTSEQINKLLTLAQNTEIMSDVRGYITTQNGNIARSTKYTLQQAYPNLHIIANEMSDSFTVTLNKSTVYEGDTAKITAIGISQDLLEYHVSHVVTLIDGSLSEAAIINRFSLNSNGNITIAPALENDTWTDVVTILVYPSYSTPDDVNAQTLTLTVRAVGVSSASLDVVAEMDAAETVECVVRYQPTVNSKQKVMSEELVISAGSTAGGTVEKRDGKWYVTSGNSSSALDGHILLEFNASIEGISVAQASGDIRVLHIPITTIVFDQTGLIKDRINCFLTPQNHGCYAGNTDTNNVLAWLRKNTHAYVGVVRSGVMRLKQLDDYDRRRYINGASSEIYGTEGQSGSKPEVFVKIPPFYFRSTYVNRSLEDTSLDTDIVKIWYSRHKPSDYDDPDSGWNYWDGNTLIGAYQPCTISSSNVATDNTCVYSFSTVDVMTTSVLGNWDWNFNNKSNSLHHTWQTNKGMYFKSTGLFERNVIMLLYLGWYYNLDYKTVLGKGASHSTSLGQGEFFPRPGFTDELGMRDTNADNGSYDGENNLAKHYYENEEDYIKYGSTNFWGFENFGKPYEAFSQDIAVNNETVVSYLEIIDFVVDSRTGTVYGVDELDVENMPTQNVSYILNYNGQTVLFITYTSATNSGNLHALKYIFGKKCLLLPKAYSTQANFSDTPLIAQTYYTTATAGLGSPFSYGYSNERHMFNLSTTYRQYQACRTAYDGPMEIIAPNESF